MNKSEYRKVIYREATRFVYGYSGDRKCTLYATNPSRVYEHITIDSEFLAAAKEFLGCSYPEIVADEQCVERYLSRVITVARNFNYYETMLF